MSITYYVIGTYIFSLKDFLLLLFLPILFSRETMKTQYCYYNTRSLLFSLHLPLCIGAVTVNQQANSNMIRCASTATSDSSDSFQITSFCIFLKYWSVLLHKENNYKLAAIGWTPSASSGQSLSSYFPNTALFNWFITTNLSCVILFRSYGYVICLLYLHYSHWFICT